MAFRMLHENVLEQESPSECVADAYMKFEEYVTEDINESVEIKYITGEFIG